ncbi:hypothetical protein K239x_16810 [Planctomycetes bacterium K23_9]|uniref:Uncharacterized protein n=1 Tax=Stieleria marina TaxID=1930275 RepID=A0A517NRH5_9BACT|nr:hypothetical protein K239x_16810 [Planctomycetes bacterium K23_9]
MDLRRRSLQAIAGTGPIAEAQADSQSTGPIAEAQGERRGTGRILESRTPARKFDYSP